MSWKTFCDPLSVRRDVRRIHANHFLSYLTPDMNIYDIGCGDKPFAGVLQGKVKSYIGVDVEDGFYDASHIDLIGNAYEVPVADNAADAVVSCQVIEHLDRPLDALKETRRILRPNGLLFLSFPFIYPIHAAPRDYFRYTEFAIDMMLRQEGFEIIERTRIGGFWYCAGFFTAMYLQTFDRGIAKRLRLAKILAWLIKSVCVVIHSIEATVMQLANRNISDMRVMWTVNYVLVARKIR